MQKEPIIAIIIGSLVGLGVAFAVWQYSRTPKNIINDHNSSINSTDRTRSDNQNQQKAVNTDELSIFSPINYSAVSDSEIELAGITDANAFIVVNLNDNQYIFRSESNGNFSIPIDLEGGINNILIKSITDNSIKSSELFIVYSSQIESETKLTTIMGSVTDISENTLQVSTMNDIIEQVSINDQTTYANITSDDQDIEFSDIAIGDFIAGIGTKDSNIYSVQRILVTEPSSLNEDIVILYGEIVELSAADFLVKNFEDNLEYSIDATGKIDVTKLDDSGEFVRARLAEATEGEKIFIVGTMEDELIASRLHIFPTSD